MKISLKDSLFLGFCAVFILTAKALLRLHLKIPGHSMFFTVFFLIIARGVVKYRFAATLSGCIAGVIAMIMGMGKGGPLLIIKFLFPALVVDLMACIFPSLFESIILCMLTGGLAGSTRFISTCIIDFLAGMDPAILVQHAAIKSVGNILFAMAGAMAVPFVIRQLKAHGVVTPEVQKTLRE